MPIIEGPDGDSDSATVAVQVADEISEKNKNETSGVTFIVADRRSGHPQAST